MSKRSSERPAPRRGWAVVLALVLLSSCATAPEEPEPEAEIAPETRALYQRGLAAMRAEEYRSAIETFARVSERNDRLAGPYVNRGIAHRALGEPEKARESLEAAIERDPANGAAYNQLGLMHRKAGRFDEAREVYQEGIEENPEYAQLYRNLGILCDIYLQKPSCALENFRAYQERTEGDDETVKRWIADVERRVE